MPEFNYTGRNRQGKLISGNLEAEDSDIAADKLFAMQLVPITIKKNRAKLLSGLMAIAPLKRKVKVKRKELIIFCRQMSTLYKAGVPINQALERLAETAHSRVFAEALRSLSGDIRSGVSLAVAMRRYPDIFSELVTNVVDVGEMTGQVEQAFLRLSEYLELEQETIQRLKSAMRYPFIVLIAMVVAFVVLNIFVIPVFAKMFIGLKGTLPLMTRVLIGMSNFMVDYWWILLTIMIAIYIGFDFYRRTPQGKYTVCRLQLKIPIVGNILKMVLYTRFAQIFGLVLSTDVAIPRGIELISAAINNAFMAHHINIMGERIANGSSIVNAINATHLFPPLMIQMLAVGEESGSMEELLNQIAIFYSREVEFGLRRMNDYLEPILLVIIAGMVLVLALGIFLPIWRMSQLAGGG